MPYMSRSSRSPSLLSWLCAADLCRVKGEADQADRRPPHNGSAKAFCVNRQAQTVLEAERADPIHRGLLSGQQAARAVAGTK